ncbi:FGGY carbohydrate kinase domain-containing protein isoform X4 [Myxocyprinus asiaticus]|uniref:FGGY carbohydrate kinase domain-containing protein isoform X4 n=1 Tax=Myxocyprinus asiaticus TaxID=70543 RepID=UPI0022231FD4|nr:FGGY carbohydrate kinase domain-containing protein isoform X4 [Myxocyprinus asiaticus]
MSSYYVGVDVGTASVRAALVTQDGHVKHMAEEPIHIWEPCADHYEQSSTDIWTKCGNVVKKVTQDIDPNAVRGIGFDATCSLVALDGNFQPVAVNQTGVKERNVLMWMDHRAAEQASRITAMNHKVLQGVGGVMSPEMQPPKLLWLKENLRESCWKETAHFFDLPDFLSWKATGSLVRSLCTLVCKWTYSPSDGWDDTFWTAIGLEDLLENSYSKIGKLTCCPGSPVGGGLTLEAAADLGLKQGTAVGASLIDAHAGGLGVIGADLRGHHLPCEKQPITSRMAIICGTSSCHMAVSTQALFVPGVWGPYLSAMLPGLWLNEGGQSATGRLVVGLTLSQTLDDLALLYLATLQAIAFGTRHIIDAMKEAGHDITTLFLCGGLSKNALFVHTHANTTGLPVVLPAEREAVLVGAAVLGACASSDYSSIQEAMEKMTEIGHVVRPNNELESFYRKKYAVFLRLYNHQKEYLKLMQD